MDEIYGNYYMKEKAMRKHFGVKLRKYEKRNKSFAIKSRG
jgi:hypothetical protein